MSADIVISNEVMVDGFTAVGKDWRLLGTGAFIKLPMHILIKNWSESYSKGVKCFENQQLAWIPICQTLGPQVYQVVTCEKKKGSKLDYKKIRQSFIEAVDHSISTMDGTLTKSHWFGRCCVQYKKWVGGSKCASCQHANLHIYSGDVEKFGALFQERFGSQLLGLNYNTWICILELGQNMKVDAAKRLYDNFDLEFAQEVVVHLARDFSSPGKCLFWNRNQVKAVFKSPVYEFYPCFVGSHGNFVYVYNKQKQNRKTRLLVGASDGEDEDEVDDLGAWPHFVDEDDQFDDGYGGDEEEDEETILGIVVVEGLKVYSDQFKEIHRTEPAPFKKCVVVSLMSKCFDGSLQPMSIIGWLDAVKRSYDGIIQRNRVTARMEAILCVRNPGKGSLDRIIRHFNTHYGEDKKNLLGCFDFAEFRKQLEGSLLPAHSVLREIMQIYIRDIGHATITPYIPPIGK